LWIENRIPGGCVYSPPRTGKTRAIRFARAQLKEFFGGVPILTMLCKDLNRASEQHFLQQLLRAVGHSLWETGSTTVKLHRLIEYLSALVEESGQPRLIWFFDEAQNLHEPEYNSLINIYNELDARDIVPIFILVGQHQLVGQLNTFETSGKTQILGRFMTQQFNFRGLTSHKDIASCLQAYDEATEFPLGSGVSFTSFFFSEAYRLSGFRLRTYAHDLWQAFQQLKDELGLPSKQEIPMQYFCRTVEYILKTRRTFDVAPTISPRIWKEAVRASGFVGAKRYLLSMDEADEE
jgi:AAA domain